MQIGYWFWSLRVKGNFFWRSVGQRSQRPAHVNICWFQGLLGAFFTLVHFSIDGVNIDGVKPPSHRTATTLRPRCDLGNPPDRPVVARYQKNAPLCDCNRDRAALAWRSDAQPLWAQLHFHYDLCVSTTLIPRPHGVLDTRSVRPSVTVQWCYYDICDRTTLLGRSCRVCCEHTASALRSYGDHWRFILYLALFHGKLECFQLIFLNANTSFFILKTIHDSIQVLIISFQIKLQC